MSDIDEDVQKWSRNFRRLKHQKSRNRGGVESSMLLDYLLYHGEHQSVQVQNTILTRAFRHEKDKNKLRLVINLARRLADRKIGRHWSLAHRYRATPNTKDPIAFDLADVVSDSLIPATDYKVQQDTVRWQIMSWLVQCGVCFEHCDWKDGVTREVLPKYDEQGEMVWKDTMTGMEVPESTVEQLLASGAVAAERFEPAKEVQSAGDIGADIYDPFRVFVDASVPMVKKLGPDQWIYLADIRSHAWIKETFGSDAIGQLKASKDLSIISTQMIDRGVPVSGVNLKDLLPLVQGSQDKDDPEMNIVLTGYQPPSEEFPEGRRVYFVPDQVALDKSENPYPEVPIIDYHWSSPGASMWTTGFLRDMQALSKFINKRFSQLGEAANAQIYEMLLLGDGLSAKDIPTDFPGVVKNGLTDEGIPKVTVVNRGNLPTFFPDSIRLSMETLETVGSSDLMSQRKFPGQLRGSMAIPMIQEIIDSEDGPRFAHLAEQFALEKMMRINRIRQFYPPVRTLVYTGNDQRNEVLDFHKEEMLPAGVDFTITVDPGSILPELSAMREARVRERMQWAPGLYTNPRTGTQDWSKVAQDLKYNDRMREGIESQGRKLARQLIRLAKQGKMSLVEQPGQPDPATGQPGQPTQQIVDEHQQPFAVYPFWPHNAMMDEYEAEMNTTEFVFGASPAFKRLLFTLHDQHRNILTSIDQARQQSVENKMVQGAMAQASQQAAAKAASTAADAAIEAVMAQREEGGGLEGMQRSVRELMGGAQGEQPQGPPQGPGGPMARRRLQPA